MGDKSGDRTYEPIVHGTTADGQEVTASFGRADTSREGHTLLSDGHRSASEFYSEGGHDHYDGRGGGTERGAYNGEGSKAP